MRLPTFIIAGAPNAGTTSLQAYLAQHPQVYMCPVKEPTFFGVAELLAARARLTKDRRPTRRRPLLERVLKRTPRPLTWEEYRHLFAGAREERAVGEASVSYIALPHAPQAIRSHLPEARLVFVLRDPAEALFTRYLKTRWRDPHLPTSFIGRFRAAQDPADRWAAAVAVGCYATNLQRFFDLFPREQIQVHLYEDYQGDARRVVRDILAFIGVDPEYAMDMSRRHNETVLPRLTGLETVRRLVLGETPLSTWLPPRVRSLLRRMYYRRRPDLTLDPADRAVMVDHYRDEILRTADLIGRDLSAWLR